MGNQMFFTSCQIWSPTGMFYLVGEIKACTWTSVSISNWALRTLWISSTERQVRLTLWCSALPMIEEVASV